MSHCDFAAGWIGGVVGLVVGHPLDTVKVNQQAHGIGIRQCVKEIYKHGYKGFFRGLAFPLLGQGFMNSAFFGVYGLALDTLNNLGSSDKLLNVRARTFSRSSVPDSQESFSRNENVLPSLGPEVSYFNIYVAACIGGLAHLSMSCPNDVIKIKLQTQIRDDPNNTKYRNPVTLGRHILKTQGVRGLYQGVTAMAWRDTPSFGVYMLVYEILANKVKCWSAERNEKPSTFGLFMAGGIAGTVCWWTIIPIDVIKSQIQAQDPTDPNYKGSMECAKQIFKTQGLKGFFRGFWSLSLRAFPVNGATLLTYEWFGFLCRYINGDPDYT